MIRSRFATVSHFMNSLRLCDIGAFHVLLLKMEMNETTVESYIQTRTPRYSTFEENIPYYCEMEVTKLREKRRDFSFAIKDVCETNARIFKNA